MDNIITQIWPLVTDLRNYIEQTPQPNNRQNQQQDESFWTLQYQTIILSLILHSSDVDKHVKDAITATSISVISYEENDHIFKGMTQWADSQYERTKNDPLFQQIFTIAAQRFILSDSLILGASMVMSFSILPFYLSCLRTFIETPELWTATHPDFIACMAQCRK